MPRKARLNVPGAIYHVMSRCLPMYQLFADDEDRAFFLQLFSACLAESCSRCYAWALMDNHYHIVLRLGEDELWRLMKPLQMRYAQHHGRKTGRRGPLFMDRYKSIVTQDQNYLEELIRYVHLNPVRAGICKSVNDLTKYRWSGHQNLMMGYSRDEFQDVKSVLRRFGDTDAEARKQYLKFVKEGVVAPESDDALTKQVRASNAGTQCGRKTGSWVIGDQEFVKKVVSSSDMQRLRISRFEQEGGDLTQLAAGVAEQCGVTIENMQARQRGGPGADARMAFAYYACRIYKAPGSRVGEFLGVGGAAISAMIKRGKEVADRLNLDK